MATKKKKPTRSDAADLRAASRLLVDATTGVTGVVEAMHRSIASGPRVLGSPLSKPAGLLTGLVYGTIRGVTKLVGRGLDGALAQLEPLLGERTPGPAREALVAALNGVLGDALEAGANPLAIPFSLRVGGEAVALEREALREAFPGASARLLVLVHGSSMNDLQWRRNGHHHGEALAAALGLTCATVHYNTGRHVSTNGRELAALLEQLVAAWPVKVEQVLLLCHSMGGLVARAACHVAEEERHTWRKKLGAVAFLGTPHHGAPLERGGAWVDFLLGVSPDSAPLKALARIRSAGVTDLRFGSVRDEDWQGEDRFTGKEDRRTPTPLPAGVPCFTIAGTTAKGLGLTRLPGDGLVPVDSALGRHQDPARALAFPEAHQLVLPGCAHLDLLDRKEAFEALRGWLAALPAR